MWLIDPTDHYCEPGKPGDPGETGPTGSPGRNGPKGFKGELCSLFLICGTLVVAAFTLYRIGNSHVHNLFTSQDNKKGRERFDPRIAISAPQVVQGNVIVGLVEDQ